MMSRSERMRCVDAWLRSGQTSMDYAACAGLDADALLRWILEYGRPSPLIPVRILAGTGESRLRAGDEAVAPRLPSFDLGACGAEHHWIPVEIQERP